MVCPGCGEKNRDEARFCTYCGTTLVLRCPTCDNEVVRGGRFCDSCGSAVDPSLQAAPTPAAPTVAARKVVTVLFADLTGSTALEERMDAESVRSILDRFYAAMRTEVERHSGRVVKFTGDGVMAAFGVPEVHEDDAARAIDTALAMRTELEELASDLQLELSLKIGINTGEVVVSADDDDVVGDAVNVASRLEGAATAGEILVGEDTWRLTRSTSRYEPIAPLDLKGKSEPVPAYRLLAVDERTADSAAAPFVGREAELGRLLDVFQECVDTHSARLVTIVGSPGLGKTRLSRELMSELADVARVRETRCDPASGHTFGPIADLMRAAAGISETDTEEEVVASLAARLPDDDPERDRIAMRAAAILGVGLAGSTEETFWAIRRLIEAAATTQPVVLVLDDIHWAEPLLLDLIEHLAEWIRAAPVLLVGTARPELRDLRPSLVEGGRAAAVIALEGLDQRATAQLALNLLETDELPSELLAKIPASTEGNPLFVRELVRMLVDDHVLVRTSDGWNVTVNVDAIQVPPTISSLLAARVDRLRSDERTVVELASVVGKEFYRGALVDLAPDHVKDLMDGVLESLRRKELVEPVGTYWIDEPVYRFHHVLIRDAAYRRLLKESRAEVHERVADWLVRKTEGLVGEHDELVAYHLEQASDYKRQLGRPDDDLAGRAAALLGEAAKRALDRDDLPSAAALSERALAVLPADDEARSELLLISCEALLSMGEVTRGSEVLDEFETLATTPRLAAWRTCFAEQLANLTSPEHLEATARRVKQAAETLGSLGDDAGAAKAHIVLANTLARLGRFAECEAALDDAITAARGAGDRRQLTATLGFAPHAALWGPNLVSRAGGRCLDIVRLLRITTGSPAVEATSLRCQAVLEAFRGRSDAARRMLRSARRTLTELGLTHELLDTEHFAGIVEIVGGDAIAAIEHLTIAYDGARAARADVLAAQSAALLARAHLMLGEDETAQRYVDVSQELGSQDLNAAIAWRSVGAELLARRGSFADAKRLAEEAVELAGRTDALIDHGNACRSLAAVLRAVGDAAGAKGAEDRALALFERKGATALLEGHIEPAVPAPMRRPGPRTVVANDATRISEEIYALCNGEDIDGVLDHLSDELVFEDRRSGLASTIVGKDAYRRLLEEVVGFGNRVSLSVIATRGQGLGLFRTMWRLPRSRFEITYLTLVALQGRLRTREVLFDETDLDAALAELDDWYVAGEGAIDAAVVRSVAELGRAYTSRDVPGIRSLLPNDLVVTDHRPASLGTLEIEGFISWVIAAFELTSLARVYASTFVRLAPGRALVLLEVHGTTNEGMAYETALHVLLESNAGLITRLEQFAVDQLDEAIARFEELERATEMPLVLANSATRWNDEVYACFNDEDIHGAMALFPPGHVHEDRRTGLTATLVGPEEQRRQLAEVVGFGNRVSSSVVAIRGDRLALIATRWRLARTGFEVSHLTLVDVGGDGRPGRAIIFDDAARDDAFTELDELFAQGEGSGNAETLRLIRRFRRAGHEARSLLTDDFVLTDHRPVGLGTLGPDEFIESLRVASELTASFRREVVAIVALAPGVLLADVRTGGESLEGGSYENAFLSLFRCRGDRICGGENFPSDRLTDAIARFEELTAGAETHQLELTNRAVRAVAALYARFDQVDIDGALALLSDDYIREDRRPGLRVTLVGVEELRREMTEVVGNGNHVSYEVVAIRGERLVLVLTKWSVRPGFVVDLLFLHEIGDDDRLARSTSFDQSALDVALAELDARYARGEGAPFAPLLRVFSAQGDAFRTRNWDAYSAVLAPDVVLVDRRPAEAGDVVGRDAYVEYSRTLTEVAPDILPCNTEILRIADDRILTSMRALTTGEGDVAFELQSLRLNVIRNGQTVRVEVFPVDQLEAAMARFEELGERPVMRENAASRAMRQVDRNLISGNPEASRSLYAEDCELYDVRAGVRLVLRGVDARIADMRSAFEIGVRQVETKVVATRGERLSLHRLVFAGEEPDAYEMEFLSIAELDADGLITSSYRFDGSNLTGALELLDERFIAGEGAGVADVVRVSGAPHRGFNARDMDAFAAAFAESIVVRDHRPASLGDEIRGRDQLAIAGLSMVEVVPGYRRFIETYLAIEPGRFLTRVMTAGENAEGGYVESPFIGVGQVGDGVVLSYDIYPVDELEAAFARFDELGPRPDDIPITNRCVAVLDEQAAYFARGEFEAGAAFYADDVVWDDRRAGLRATSHGFDATKGAMLSWTRVGFDRFRRETIAVRGERLAIELWRVADRSGFETFFPSITEIDGRRITRVVVFDEAQLDEAFAELDELYVASEGAEYADAVRMFGSICRAVNARRLDEFRSMLADDAVIRDHRPASLGQLSADERAEAAQAMIDVIPTIRAIPERFHALASDRFWAQARLEGTNDEDGDVDFSYQVVGKVAGDRLVHVEWFPDAMAGDARALFDSLGPRPDASHWVPPNAAFALGAESRRNIVAGDWEAYSSRLAPDILLDDRRAVLAWSATGRDAVIERIRALWGPGYDTPTTCLATRGSRLSLERRVMILAHVEGSWESDRLILRELDADGRMSFMAFFDPDDLTGAIGEMERRYVEREGAAFRDVLDVTARQVRAYNDGDLDAMRAIAHDDVVTVDHRPAGAGTIVGAEARMGWGRALGDLAQDVETQCLEWVRLAPNVSLGHFRVVGHTADGADVDPSAYIVNTVRDGRLARAEHFALSERDAAIARFEELAAESDVGWVPMNAALRRTLRLNEAMLARDPEPDPSDPLMSPDFVLEDNRTGLRWKGVGRDAARERGREYEATYRSISVTPLATRGEKLGLGRMVLAADFDSDRLFVQEIDDDGRSSYLGFFDPDDFPGAFDELDRRYLSSLVGFEHEEEEFFARVRSVFRERDWASFSSVLSDDFEHIDHRLAGAGVQPGVEPYVSYVRGWVELVPDTQMYVVRLIRTADDRRLVEQRLRGRTTEGTEAERHSLMLFCFRDGKVTRIESFDPDQIDAAIARVDELGSLPDEGWVAPNRALREARRGAQFFKERDWDAWTERDAPDVHLEDRRTGLGWQSTDLASRVERAKEYASTYRRIDNVALATRGEKLGLCKQILSGDFVSERLFVNEIDDEGRAVFGCWFDADDYAGAFAELDRRYLEGEGADAREQLGSAAALLRALNDHDLAAARDLLRDDLVAIDHRPVTGAGQIDGPDEYLRWIEVLWEQVPDIETYIVRTVGRAPDRALVEVMSFGHADGALVEFRSFILSEARHGKWSRIEQFGPDDIDAALARFDELGTRPDEARHWAPENTASRMGAKAVDYVASRDWDALFATYAPDFHLEERRTGLRSVAVGHEEVRTFLGEAATILRTGSTYTRIATFGDRLALGRLSIGDPTSDRWTSEMLALYELNEDGLVAASITFDPDDYASAAAEMITRYGKGEGRFAAEVLDVVTGFAKALRDRDWDRYRSFLAEDFVHLDHRPVGAGEMVGRDRHLEYAKALFDLTPDAHLVVTEIVRIATDAVLTQQRLIGTSTEDALVEIAAYRLHVVRDGRITRTESFGPDDRAAAIARFDELGPQPPSTRHWAPANTAFHAGRRSVELIVDRDWSSLTDLYAEDARLEDRRSGVRHIAGGRDAVIEYCRASATVMRARVTTTCLTAWGDRLAIVRLELGDPEQDRWTNELLSLYEVDEAGRLTYVVAFDIDSVEGAVTELAERYALGEGAAFADIVRLDNEGALLHARRDWDAFAQRHAPDFVMIDHRPVGAGTITGRDDQMQYVRTGADVVPGAHFLWRPEIITITPNAMLRTIRLMGREEEGADVELVSLNICIWRDGLVTRLEQFPADQRERARARFDELAAGGDSESASPVNAAPGNASLLPVTRATEIAGRFKEAYAQQDWDTIRSLYADAYECEDHRTGVRLVGDADQQWESVREMWNVGFTRFWAEPIATRGDRLVLTRGVFSDDAGNEVEILSVTEVDELGLRTWSANFDPDDLDHAFDVLEERYASGEGAAFAEFILSGRDLVRSYADRDWDAYRAHYTDDVVVIDHRPVGWGTIVGIDAWVEHFTALVDLIPDVRVRMTAIHAIDEHKAVRQTSMSGTNTDGGNVEQLFVTLSHRRGHQVSRMEIFPLERLDDALARFNERRTST